MNQPPGPDPSQRDLLACREAELQTLREEAEAKDILIEEMRRAIEAQETIMGQLFSRLEELEAALEKLRNGAASRIMVPRAHL
jgi:hypothetical protein